LLIGTSVSVLFALMYLLLLSLFNTVRS